MHVLSFLAFFLFTFASAQVTSSSKFTNTWLSNYVVGLTYQISWTVGDDRAVSLAISNSTWSLVLASSLPPQTTTSFEWTVPSSLSSLSSYALSLNQDGPASDVSPPFSVDGPAKSPNTSSTTLSPLPTNQNGTMALNGTGTILTPGCTGTGAMVATSSYWDTGCGCMKTAIGPAVPTGYPGSFNYTGPSLTGGSDVLEPTLPPYMPLQSGKAAKLGAMPSKFGLLGAGFAAAVSAFIIG